MAHADGVQELIRGCVHGDAVQHLDMALAVLALGVGADIGHLEVGELNALDGIAIGNVAVAKVGYPAVIAENIVYTGFIFDAGADVGAVPHAVLLGVGEVVLVDFHTADTGRVDGSIRHICGESAQSGRAEARHDHEQNECLFPEFHLLFPFLFQ